MTYGDGVSDIDISASIAFHKQHGGRVTIDGGPAIGAIRRIWAMDGTAITPFQEKPQGEGGWINGGFFVLSPKVLDEIHNDAWHV